jgi:putative oxidoreductase
MHHDSGAATQALTEMDGFRRIEKEQHTRSRSELFALGRLLLGVIFLLDGLAKLVDLTALERTVSATVLTGAGFLVPMAAAIQLLGGLLLAVGYQGRAVAAGLAVYLAGVTIFLHLDLTSGGNPAAALSNLALSGGLLLIIGQGSGALSVDGLVEQRRLRREGL